MSKSRCCVFHIRTYTRFASAWKNSGAQCAERPLRSAPLSRGIYKKARSKLRLECLDQHCWQIVNFSLYVRLVSISDSQGCTVCCISRYCIKLSRTSAYKLLIYHVHSLRFMYLLSFCRSLCDRYMSHVCDASIIIFYHKRNQ